MIKSLIIIDDEEELRDSLKDFLSMECDEVYATSRADEGLKIIIEKNPQIIVSDVNMPVMKGPDLLKKLREQNINTPVLFITGNFKRDIQIPLEYRMNVEIIEKPFDFDDMLVKIKGMIGTLV